MTWVDVASDAVKIGLGALIGGGVSLLSAKLVHKHRKEEEYTTRRRDSLESIMPEFDEISHEIMGEVAMALKALKKTTKNIVEIDKRKYNYSKREAEVRDHNHKLNVVEAKVALLDFPDLAELVNSYRATALEACKIEKSKERKIIRIINEIEDLRNYIIQGFAKAYKSA